MAKALFIIPFYNEEKRILINEFALAFKNFNTIDFLLVNDGSFDLTQKIIENFSIPFSNVKVLNLEKNQGKAEAIRMGMLHSKNLDYDYFGYLDADLSTPIAEVIKLLEFAKTNPHLKLIMGTRIKLLGNNIIRSNKRHYLGRIFATIISNLILKTPVYDTQCGAKIIKSDIVNLTFSQKFKTRWLFDVEMLLRLKKNQISLVESVAEFPLSTWIEKGNTKIKFIEFIHFPFQLIKIYFQDVK
jgi:glycosyltransferase involved in cell wall biosynthesis